ncbi:MAG: hypothetical protein WCO78_02675 [Candidatus Roizmanbacteria bacterium]
MEQKSNMSPLGEDKPSVLPVSNNTNPQPLQPNQTVVQPAGSTPTIVTILLLLFALPIGIIVMWIWPKWKIWVKILLTVLPILPFLLIMPMVIALLAINPAAKFREARNISRNADVEIIQRAIEVSISGTGRELIQSISTKSSGPIRFASSSGPDMIHLCESLTRKGGNVYLPKLPTDPSLKDKNGAEWKGCADFDTGYDIAVSETEITVTAPLKEQTSKSTPVEISPQPQE